MESSGTENRESGNAEAGPTDLAAWTAAAYDAMVEVTDSALRMTCEAAEEGPKVSATAYVGLETGEITLQIGIDVDEAGAAKLTRALLMMEEDEEVELEDITDAMGEIANMVAGGVKSRLIAVESSLTIGLPHFVEGETDDSNTLVLHQHWLTARDSAGDIPVCLSITRPRAS